ncbi:MAG: hypothetical protein SVW51_09085 [Pseudomonadota bacterium]|nr:hypothetical protein [Pseudomonadota bacterium]
MNRLSPPRSKGSLRAAVLASVITFSPFCVLSDEDITVSYDYEMTDKLDVDYQVDMHTPDLMGDVFNVSSGTIQLQNVDIDIPGNSALKVQLRRIRETVRSSRDYSMLNSTGFIIGSGSWYFDTPRLTYDIPQDSTYQPKAIRNGKYCSGDFTVNSVLWNDYMALRPKDYNTGYKLFVPGESSASLIRNTGAIPGAGDAQYVTKDMWKISCLTSNGQEAFSAVTPSGVKYTFDIRKKSEKVGTYSGSAQKITLVFFASKVEDRFGNWVKYNYQTGELKSITSNDGRQIDIVRTLDGADVTSHGKLWRYKQNGNRVELPDGRYWSYSFPTVNEADGTSYTSGNYVRFSNGGLKSSSPDALTGCGIGIHVPAHGFGTGSKNQMGLSPLTSLIGNSYLDGFPYTTSGQAPQHIEVHHPDGAIGKFWLGLSLQGATNVDPDIHNAGDYSHITTPRCNLQPSLMKKSIEYANGKVYEWHYQYSNEWGSYIPNRFISESKRQSDLVRTELDPSIYRPSGVNKYDYKVVRVVKPDGSYLHHYINRDYQSHLENKVVNTTYFDVQNHVVQEVRKDYIAGKVWGAEPTGLEFNVARQKSEFTLPVLKSTETVQYDSNGNTTVYNKDYSQFNGYDQPTIVHHYNSFSNDQRYYKFGYHNDTINWVLGQPSFLDISSNGASYTRVKDTTYHNATGSYKGLPNCRKSFEQTVYCNTSYWTGNSSAGSPRRVTLSSTNRWVEYSNYKRGIPQTIAKPNSTSTTPKYAYNVVNNIGLVTRFIDYEGHCTVFDYDDRGLQTQIDPCGTKWATTNITYSTTSNDEGLNFVEAGMFKQSVSQGNYRKTTYFDHMLRPILVKEWDSSDENNTQRFLRKEFNHENQVTYQSIAHSASSTPYGSTTLFDALGRVVRIDDNTTSGNISYTYLSGNRIRLNDNLGNSTTTTYLAYGSPAQKYATQILSPESVTTDIVYNLFGNITSISQGGTTENRVYDTRQLLCKTVRPDIGNTAYNFNSLGELQWQASGSSVDSSTTACDNNVASSQKTIFTYDNLGSIRHINYGDTSPDKTFTYDKNGNTKSITAGGVVNSYDYNTANLLEYESVKVDNLTFSHSYAYSNLAHIDSITYPNGELVEYEPNGLGQPTIAAGYAYDVKYHPNGMIREFTYGNGFVHKTDLYASGLPKDIYDLRGFTRAMDHGLTFDANGNLIYLRDDQNTTYNFSLDYDELDRLEFINDSARGIGKLEYDNKGNISSYKLGSRTLSYFYSSNGRLDSISGGIAYDFDYDDRGNITNNGRGQTFTYNLAQHVNSASSGFKTLNFTYDGNDKRVVKSIGGKKYYFIYGLNGKLLHKREDGIPANQIYLGNRIIAENINNTTPPKKQGSSDDDIVGPGLPTNPTS